MKEPESIRVSEMSLAKKDKSPLISPVCGSNEGWTLRSRDRLVGLVQKRLIKNATFQLDRAAVLCDSSVGNNVRGPETLEARPSSFLPLYC